MPQARTVKLPFFCDCVGWPRQFMPVLNELVIEGREITRRTFLRHAEIDPTIIPAWDYAIRYFSYRGIYWFVHSSIENVYATFEQIQKLLTKLRG